MTSETLDDLLTQVAKDCTLADIAAGCGVSVRALHDLRIGKSAPRRATVIALAARLGVPEQRVVAAIEASRAVRG